MTKLLYTTDVINYLQELSGDMHPTT